MRILLTALRLSVSVLAPCHSAGYSSAPTPMIAPWPCIRRGTEWTVPMVPGLVRVIVVPWKSSTVSLLPRALRTIVLVGGPEVGEVHRLGGLDARHEQLAGAVGLGHVDGQAEVDVGRA